MYGLVNKAVEDLAVSTAGPAACERIRRRAGAPEAFVGLRSYDDAVTARLVAAAAEVLGLPEEEVLAAFGEHWVRYTAEQGWGPVLAAAGTSVPEVLLGLDALHARVRLTMPALDPPSFRCTDVTATGLRLHHLTRRAGFAPMVVGLVRGLGERFGTPVEVVHDVRRADGADHDEFLVTWAP